MGSTLSSGCATVHLIGSEFLKGLASYQLYGRRSIFYTAALSAGIAQSVEQLTRNEKVGGSIPLSGTSFVAIRFPIGDAAALPRRQ